jgi:hypothetical protein
LGAIPRPDGIGGDWRSPPFDSPRDEQRRGSEQTFLRAPQILLAASVPRDDANFLQAVLDAGTPFFDRGDSAPPEEKPELYRKALAVYQEAEALFADDPRVWHYEGFCYERLGLSASSPQETRCSSSRRRLSCAKHSRGAHRAWRLNPVMPYRALATIHFDAGDDRTALDLLKQARRIDSTSSSANSLDRISKPWSACWRSERAKKISYAASTSRYYESESPSIHPAYYLSKLGRRVLPRKSAGLKRQAGYFLESNSISAVIC